MLAPRNGRRVGKLLFEGVDLREPADVPHFMSKLCAQKGMNAFTGCLYSDDSRAKNQDVHVVMLDSLVSGVAVVAQSGANAAHLVGGHAGSDAAAADEHASFGLTVKHGAADFFGVVGIVHGSDGVGADVEDLVALLFQGLDNGLFQIVPCMITTDGNEHA